MGGSDWQMGRMGQSGTSVDVADNGEEFVVAADLPGFDTEDIDVSIREDVLRIEAEHEEERDEGAEGDRDEGRYIRRERRHQSVGRSVTLPERVDEESVTAEYRNGVLTVTLPKSSAQDDDSHQIDIS